MRNPEEKRCPLTQLFCYGEECGWWRQTTGCSVTTLAHTLHGTELELSRVVNELYMIRKELEIR